MLLYLETEVVTPRPELKMQAQSVWATCDCLLNILGSASVFRDGLHNSRTEANRAGVTRNPVEMVTARNIAQLSTLHAVGCELFVIKVNCEGMDRDIF
jgi:hypothetical protein